MAAYLAGHPKVLRVNYLGHLAEGSPQCDLYRRQCLGPGAMISFEVAGAGSRAPIRFLNSLQLIQLAVSLGSTEIARRAPRDHDPL